ncbi:MAG: hypothetical protein WBM99_05235 [Psychromonas sp.]
MLFLLRFTLFMFFMPSVFAELSNTSSPSSTYRSEQAYFSENKTLEMNAQESVVDALKSSQDDETNTRIIQPSQSIQLQPSGQTAEQIEILRFELSEVKKQLQRAENSSWQFRKSLTFSGQEVIIDNTMLAMLTALLSLLIALLALFLSRKAKKTAEMQFLLLREANDSERVNSLAQNKTAMTTNDGEANLTDADKHLFNAQTTATESGDPSDARLTAKTPYEDDLRGRLAHFDQKPARDDLRKFIKNVNNRLAHKEQSEYSSADNFDNAILLFHQQAYPAAITSLNNVISNPGSSNLLIIDALFNKAYCLQKCQQARQAMCAYDELISRVAKDDPIELQQQVLKSLFGKAFILKKLNVVEQEIAVYEQIVSRFTGFTDLFFELHLNIAMMRKALALANKGSSSDVLSIFDDIITRLTKRSELKMQQIVAQAMVHKSNYLNKIGQLQASSSCSESLISRFAQSNDLKLQTLVAQSVTYLLDLYDIQEKPLAAIELCDNIHLRFSEHNTLLFTQIMARSLATKANILLKFNKIKDAVKLFDEIIARYKDSKEPTLQTAVRNALTNAAVFSIRCEDIITTQLRIKEAEKVNQVTSLNYVMMVFTRFLIDNLTLADLIDKTEKLAENAKFEMTCDPLKSFIKRLPAEKKKQASAVLDFFENHHDLDKFKKTLGESDSTLAFAAS